MCPMQCRTNGIKINDAPRYQSKVLEESTNNLQVEDQSYEEGGMLNITFQLSGFTSYSPVRKPTNADWEDDLTTKVELAAEDPVWDLTSPEFSEQECAAINYRGEVVTRETTAGGKFFVNSVGT